MRFDRDSRHLRHLLGVLAAILLACPARADDKDYELWYSVRWDGQPAGWMHVARAAQGERVTNSSELHMSLKRGAITIEIVTESEFVETSEGDPLSMRYSQKIGAAPILTRYRFVDGAIEIESEVAGNVTRFQAPVPEGAWLTPEKSSEYVRRLLLAGEKKIASRTILPESGASIVEVTMSDIEKTNVAVLGKTVPAYRVRSTTSVAPGMESTDFISEQGVPLKTSVNIGMGVIELIAADREIALATISPPEVMKSTLITPDRPIENPRAAGRASYILSGKGRALELPGTGSQSVERLADDRARVVVDVNGRHPAAPADAADPRYTQRSAMLDTNDPEIKALVEKATAGVGQDKAARAEAMRRFVHEYIDEKGLDVGFASASDVARVRQGDCSEHGALLAAMLRADGIPSRVATGLLYVDEFLGAQDVFGYHMWAQALLTIDGNPTWVDLDGVFPPQLAYDATHITLAVSSLSDNDPVNGMVALATTLGSLEVKVELVKPR